MLHDIDNLIILFPQYYYTYMCILFSSTNIIKDSLSILICYNKISWLFLKICDMILQNLIDFFKTVDQFWTTKIIIYNEEIIITLHIDISS